MKAQTALTHNSKHKIKVCGVMTIALVLASCGASRAEKEYESVKKNLQGGNVLDGLISTEHMIRQQPQNKYTMLSALEAESACLKEKACEGHEEIFLRYVTERSHDEKEIIRAQKRLCELLYDKGLYKQAIEEMNRLLSKEDFQEGRNETRLKLARANFFIKNFFQAQAELKNYLKGAKTEDEKFAGYLLQADIQTDDKKFTEAMKTYQLIEEQFKPLFLKNQVYLNEALLLEEQKQLDQAIQLLEAIKVQVATPEIVQQKIERLKEQKSLQPGAAGLQR